MFLKLGLLPSSRVWGRRFLFISSPYEVLYRSPGPGNCLWFSPAQSFLVSSLVGTHGKIFVNLKTDYMFRNGDSSSTRGRVGPSE
jgi:hypothetical protein